MDAHGDRVSHNSYELCIMHLHYALGVHIVCYVLCIMYYALPWESTHVLRLPEITRDCPRLGKGGEDTFPALGVSVRPEAGRLLLFEVAMPDGGCGRRDGAER